MVSTEGYGGGIYNTGWLTVQDSLFSANAANSDKGGGIWTSNTATIETSTLVENTAAYLGGGMFNAASGTLNVTNTTLNNNNSTYGGGIYNYGTLNLTSSTLNGNRGTYSGVFNGGSTPTMNIANTIIANSLGLYDCFIELDRLGINEHNMMEHYDCGNEPVPGLGASLGLLDFYGGPTKTHALLPGSPAMDAGSAVYCPETDQRGVTRPVGVGCDVGAFEFDPVPQVVSSAPADGTSLSEGPSSIEIVFNKDILADGSTAGADHPDNYFLVVDGPNTGFETMTCGGGLAGDDILVVIDQAVYDIETQSAILSFPDGAILAPDQYQLLICGTTSLEDLFGLKLNYGLTDTKILFTVHETSTADFSASPISGLTPLSVTFNNLSGGDYDTCLWDYGDGVTSAECDGQVHHYALPGVYSVTLSINGPGGPDVEIKTRYITVYDPVMADFSASPVTGFPPLLVSFTNLSQGDYDACTWDFGDAKTGEDCSTVAHVYGPGVSSVSLMLSGPGGTDFRIRTNYIKVMHAAFIPLVCH
jgi:PKD repeat protein